MDTQKLDWDIFSQVAEKDFLKEIIENTPAAFVVMDKLYNVLYANEYLLQLKGLTADELRNHKCYEISNGGVMCSRCSIARAMDTGKKQYILKEEVDRSGRPRYMDNYAIPLYHENGGFDYLLEIILDRTEEMRLQKQLEGDFYRLIDALSIVIEAKDAYTGNHSKSVQEISMLIADAMGLEEQTKRDIYVAASLHDIGKVGISDTIINKPSKLDEEEFALIRRHPRIAYDILKGLSGFDTAKDFILYHHERWDGKGYPDGIRGTHIPVGARVIAVADTYDAMTSNRSYRAGLPLEAAIAEIRNNAGAQFDPSVAEAFCKIIIVLKDRRQYESAMERLLRWTGGRLA